MITPITATFPALNFPKEVDYPTQEDWAAFSAAAELNYGILSGTWSDKSEEFKAQTNNLASEIQEIGENAFNAISLDTIEDLATYTGTGLVMVKDLNRGGTFIYDATKSAVNNGGTIFNGWARQYSGAVNVKWFGAVGDGVTNDTDAFYAASSFINTSSGGKLIIPKSTYIVGKQLFAGTIGKGYAYKALDIIVIKNCVNPVIIESQGAILKVENGLKFGSFDPITGDAYYPTLPFVNYNYRADIGYIISGINNSSIEITGSLEIDGNIQNANLGGLWGDAGRQCLGHGVRLLNNKIVKVSDVYTHHNTLDGLYIGNNYVATEYIKTPITLINIVSEYNARQGLSFGGGSGLVAINCNFNHTGKSTFNSKPSAGVDIEAEYGKIRDALFINCEFINNSGSGMVADSGDTKRVTFLNCRFSGNSTITVWPNKPSFTFRDCLIAGGIGAIYGSPNIDETTKFYNCKITNEASEFFDGIPTTTRLVDSTLYANAFFKDCTFINTIGRYIELSKSKIEDCRIYHTAGTESIISDRGLAVNLNVTIFKNLIIEENITNLPDDGYYVSIDNASFSGKNNLISPSGKLKWTSWSNGAEGYSGVLGSNANELTPNRFLTLIKDSPIRRSSWAGIGKFGLSSAIPTSGTWNKTDRLFNQNPAVGSPKGWICTVSGTSGTLNGGNTTGNIGSGSPTLVVSSVTGLAVGDYIQIAGSGIATTTYIKSISGTTVTLSANATTTVTNAVVSYYPPTFVSEGNL